MAATTSLLERLSDELAAAVQRAGRHTVSVHGRRRMPASGVMWSDDGLIVTSHHVLERDSDLRVGLPSGEMVDATLVGRDPGTDLALLRVAGVAVEAMARAEHAAEIGTLVLAIGRPGADGAMASLGVVTTVGGEWVTTQGTRVEGFLRTDAGMLPGFSGGPLVNGSGALLGVNSSTLGRGGGLTLPHVAIAAIVESLLAHGHVRIGYLGIGTQQVELPARVVTEHQLPEREALVVVQIESGGPADEAGLVLGDVVIAADDQPTTSLEVLQAHLRGDRIGTLLHLRLLRGGVPHLLSVTIGGR